MKTKVLLASIFSVAILLGACKKGDTMSGKYKITGTVTYDDGVNTVNGIAPEASVFITYGSLKATGKVDETVTCDGIGVYTVKGLKKGDYFVSGEYITSHGFKYTTTGYGITVASGKTSTELNIRLQ